MSKSTKLAAGGSDCASTYRKGRLGTLHSPVSFDMKEPERRNGCSTKKSFSVYKITSRVVPWPLLCVYIWHITDYGSEASSIAGELSFLISALGVPAFQLHTGNCGTEGQSIVWLDTLPHSHPSGKGHLFLPCELTVYLVPIQFIH